MMRSFLITVDVLRLRANLSAEEGREISSCEARQLLYDAGFVVDGEHWLVPESELSHLRPEEVTSAEVVGVADHDHSPNGVR